MKPILASTGRALRRAALQTVCLSGLLAGATAQADPVFAPYAGSGNAVLFDAVTGDGGWVGAIDQVPDPGVSDPLSLVSVVLFTYDAVAHTLSGSFVFTTSADLSSTLFGQVSGTTADADIFGSGGQWALDYDIQGGSGLYTGASGFGLAFLQFDPAGAPDNYTETGLLVFGVPEPGALPLAALGLLGLLGVGAQRRSLRPE